MSIVFFLAFLCTKHNQTINLSGTWLMAPKRQQSSSSESVSEEEPVAKALVGRVAAKSHPPPPPSPDSSESDSSPSPPKKEKNPTRGEVEQAHDTGRGRTPATSARGSKPEMVRGSKGKGKKGQRQTCQICWHKVGNGESALSQHQYWSETCNAWRFYRQGQTWEAALRAAHDLTKQREEEDMEEVPVEAGGVLPARSLKHKKRLEAEAEARSKRTSLKEDKKEKTKKRKRAKGSEKSPDPVRKEKHRKPPPSSGDESSPDILRMAKKLIRAIASK